MRLAKSVIALCSASVLAWSASSAGTPADLRMNEIQAVGSHNSYKIAIPADELALIAQFNAEAAQSLDYGHIPLAEQLELGMRQLELDVFLDPEGGRYADPLLPKMVPSDDSDKAAPYYASAMGSPGFKVMHIQDIDQRSHCATFVACLFEMRDWSKANPEHEPILVLINAKDAPLPLPGAKVPLAFDETAFAALDAEIRSVLKEDQLITPDDVRGDAATLRQALMSNGWPRLSDTRGKFLFAIDESPEKIALYRRGQASLEGLAAFVNTDDPGAPYAAYFTMNNPVRDTDLIRERVQLGFLVRTRADAGTKEARTGDTQKREAAFASGAQYISTDYYLPRSEWSDYSVRLPGGDPVRCNPALVGPQDCPGSLTSSPAAQP